MSTLKIFAGTKNIKYDNIRDMDIKEFKRIHKMNSSQFAELVGISRASVCNYLKGKRFPTQPTIKLIEIRTGGKITELDLWKYAEKLEKIQKNKDSLK